MNIEAILKVADAIEKHSIPDLGFNMGTFHSGHAACSGPMDDLSGHKCGTVACVAGWTIAVLKPEALSDHEVDFNRVAAELLGLEYSLTRIEELFYPHNNDGDIDATKTSDDAVRTLRNLASTGKVDWHASGDRA